MTTLTNYQINGLKEELETNYLPELIKEYRDVLLKYKIGSNGYKLCNAKLNWLEELYIDERIKKINLITK